MTDKALFHRPERIVIPVPHYVLDDTLETVQGKSNTVRQLYEDYVLGKLDPAQLAGGGVYDAEDATSVDPMNHFGITLEETTSIADEGAQAAGEVRKHVKQKQAEAARKAAEEAAKKAASPAE